MRRGPEAPEGLFRFLREEIGTCRKLSDANLLEQEGAAQVLQYRQPADSSTLWLGQIVFDYLSAADRNVTVGAQFVIPV